MSLIGSSVEVKGEVSAADDLVVEGRVEGPVWCEGRTVTVGASGAVRGDILAHNVIVLGAVNGAIVADGLVDIRATARVVGRVVAPRFALQEGAGFSGAVQPQHLEAAMSVARHRRAVDEDEPVPSLATT